MGGRLCFAFYLDKRRSTPQCMSSGFNGFDAASAMGTAAEMESS